MKPVISLQDCLGLDKTDRLCHQSGDTLLIFIPQMNEPPAAAFATFDTRNSHLVLDLDDTTAESLVFKGILPRHYAGGGITVYIHYAMTSAITGAIVLSCAVERIGDALLDIDADSFATAVNSASTTVSGTSGNVNILSIALTAGAQMDSLAVGEAFRLKIARVPADAGDTAAGDCEIVGCEIKET